MTKTSALKIVFNQPTPPYMETVELIKTPFVVKTLNIALSLSCTLYSGKFIFAAYRHNLKYPFKLHGLKVVMIRRGMIIMRNSEKEEIHI